MNESVVVFNKAKATDLPKIDFIFDIGVSDLLNSDCCLSISYYICTTIYS